MRKLSKAERKDRREYIMLVLVSSVFTAIGVAMWFGAHQLIGLIAAMFFAACLLTGVTKLLKLNAAAEQLAMIVVAFSFAAASAALLYAAAASHRPFGLVAGIAGFAGFTFFGGGGILMLINFIRRKSRPR